MGIRLLSWVEERLAINQSEYLSIEVRVMENCPPEDVAQVLQFDPVYQRLMVEERRLLELRDEELNGGSIELAEPPCRLRGYQWELRRKYRGKPDGAKQPTKRQLAKFRYQRRRVDEFANLVN